MKSYRVLEKCFVQNKLMHPGETVHLPDDFDAGPHLQPTGWTPDKTPQQQIDELARQLNAANALNAARLERIESLSRELAETQAALKAAMARVREFTAAGEGVKSCRT